MSMLPWYVARAAGLVSWALLAAATLWGLALSTGALGRRPRPNWLLDLHRWLGGTALVFTGVHVVALLADQYVHFGLTEILVPFASSWHPVAVAWGVVAALPPAGRRAHVAGARAACRSACGGGSTPRASCSS